MMSTNYNDERLKDVEAEKDKALDEVNTTYDDMIQDSDSYYQSQVDATKEWEQKQSELQQERTDFAIEQIEQQKEQAEKDYTKEQSGAYVDWQKASGSYGANAEAMASNGLSASGYSESSQVSMYNTYQNRVASARDSYNRAILNYDNNIKEAQLQNSTALAEISYQSLQKQLEIALQGFQYENELLLAQLSAKMSVEEMYHNRYQDVLAQINQENALQEEQRQYDENLKWQREQFYASMIGGGSSGGELLIKDSDAPTEKNETYEVSTDYYRGDKNPDALKYGTFKNGYQPKGISGYGEVKKTGKTIEVNTVTLSGEKRTVKQNVWKTPDGALWYWQGRENRYIRIPGSETFQRGKNSRGGGYADGVVVELME